MTVHGLRVFLDPLARPARPALLVLRQQLPLVQPQPARRVVWHLLLIAGHLAPQFLTSLFPPDRLAPRALPALLVQRVLLVLRAQPALQVLLVQPALRAQQEVLDPQALPGPLDLPVRQGLATPP